MTGTKGAACSERDGVIVPRKRQWPDAGIALVIRGGPSFLAHSVVVAYIAKLVKKTTFYIFINGMSDYGFLSDKAAGIVHRPPAGPRRNFYSEFAAQASAAPPRPTHGHTRKPSPSPIHDHIAPCPYYVQSTPVVPASPAPPPHTHHGRSIGPSIPQPITSSILPCSFRSPKDKPPFYDPTYISILFHTFIHTTPCYNSKHHHGPSRL